MKHMLRHAQRDGTRCARRYRPALSGLTALFLAASLAVCYLVAPAAQAVYAAPDGGSGRFESVIDWIDWTEASNVNVDNNGRMILPDGVNSTVWSTPSRIGDGLWRSSQCSISEVETHYEVTHEGVTETYDAGLVVGYDTGSWIGDGMARLYNDSTRYDNGVEIDPNYGVPGISYRNVNVRSGLPIGIANAQGGRYNESANAYFKIQCKTYIVESAVQPTKSEIADLPKTELPMEGFVYADAEGSNWKSGQYESETVAPIPMDGYGASDVKWRYLETARSQGCTVHSWVGQRDFPYPTGVKNGFQLRPATASGGEASECATRTTGSPSNYEGYGPSSILFMEKANGGYVELKGGGVSAIAFGVVTYLDYGDAPESYGSAASLFQPNWERGELGEDIAPSPAPVGAEGTWYDLSAAQEAGQAVRVSAPDIRLGNFTDPDIFQYYSENADLDDRYDSNVDFSPPDDEDALSIDPTAPVGSDNWDGIIRTAPGLEWTKHDIICHGEGNIVGWIDWNHNGTFDDAEASAPTVCPASGRASLTWTVPSDVVRSVDGETGSAFSTFMRLRITGDRNPDGSLVVPRATGVTLSGEVEDYGKITVMVPTLELIKTVDNAYASEQVPGLSAEQWTVGANGTVALSGQGSTGGPRAVDQGSMTLYESSDDPQAVGYQAGQWECTETPGTDSETYSSTVSESTDGEATLTVRNQDRVTCTIANTTKPGTLTWNKVEVDGSTAIGGSQWTLSGPGVPDGTVITDCVGACAAGAYTDQDPAAGAFSLTGLRWGDYAIEEAVAPAGYRPVTGSFAFTRIEGSSVEGALIEAEGVVNGGVVNERLTGSVSWTKTDADNGEPLAGAAWGLTGPEVPEGTVVDDCVAEPCTPGAYRDEDPAAGSFKVGGLVWSEESYVLTEVAAPAGYQMDATPHAFVITTDSLDYAFAEPFENSKTSVPSLPLTGGLGSDWFLIGGGVLALVALIVGIVRRRRAQA
ncbi:LPXTG cell wall anchor domain-containing protein [Actinomyces sp. Z3]|nr:LPXTG cell wall anchor domain-containing protein [Actinomyces sp. Z3]